MTNNDLANLYTKARWRNLIFILTTVVLLPIANRVRAHAMVALTYDFFNKYENLFSSSNDPIVFILIENIDKSFYIAFSAFVWVAFAIVGLLLVKLIYRKHILQKQVFKATLIAYTIKIGLFIILCAGSFVIYIFNLPGKSVIGGIVISQFRPPVYIYDAFSGTLDIIFMLTLFIGFIVIYSKPIKHSLIRLLGGEVKTSINQQ